MDTTLTPRQLWQLQRVGQPVPLPDGSAALVPVTAYDLDTNVGTTLLYRVDGSGAATALTTAEAKHPAIDSTGERVAFTRAAPAEPAQLYVMPLGGGEARRLTSFPLGVGESKWLRDGSALIAVAPLLRGFASLEATTGELAARRQGHESALATEDRVYRYWKRWLIDGQIHHLFRIDAATGEAADLTPELEGLLAPDADPVGTFDVSSDGKLVAFTAEVLRPGRPWLQFAVHTVPTTGGEVSRLTADPPAQQRRPRFTPDGTSLVYGIQREHAYYADRVRLTRFDLDSREERVLTEDWDGSPTGWELAGSDRVVFAAEHEGRTRLFTTDLSGEEPQSIEAVGSCHGPRPVAGRIWCRTESAARPPEIGVVENDSVKIVSSFNDDVLAGITLGETDVMTVAGTAGQDIEVKLVYPPGFHDGKKWPLLHNIHGGPHGLVNDDWHWRWNTQALASAGYLVASVNFHGSTSWGEAFTGSIRGKWGDKPYLDVMAATDALIAGGYVDEDRMAIAGGSYGGYLVTWITAKTDRFKASVCHAGVTDLLGQWASDVTEGREKAVGGVPWEDMDAVLRWSPLAHTHNIVTPTLVVHGELDYRVVVTQGLSLYGILQQKGVPSRLLYYPDEGHWIESPANSIRWYNEVLAWLGRWV